MENPIGQRTQFSFNKPIEREGRGNHRLTGLRHVNNSLYGFYLDSNLNISPVIKKNIHETIGGNLI